MNLSDQRFLRRIGDRVRELRNLRGWTQVELGEKCELHRTFIGSVERGERNISILNLRVFAGALRVPIAELFADQPAK
jgi:transcriptional regulator with XRE-family HTH domain